jgi:hypothetical protein
MTDSSFATAFHLCANEFVLPGIPPLRNTVDTECRGSVRKKKAEERVIEDTPTLRSSFKTLVV